MLDFFKKIVGTKQKEKGIKMLNFDIFEGSAWGVAASAKYECGFHFQEIDHGGYGEILTGDDVRQVVRQIIDHVNNSEELITPFDMDEPSRVSRIGDDLFLEWRGVLDGLNRWGESDNLTLVIEIGKCD